MRPSFEDHSGGEVWKWSPNVVYDVQIPPQRVYAFAAMQSLTTESGGAFSGISFYWTGSQDAAVPHPVGVGQRHGVVPYIFDDKVWRIEFICGLATYNSTTDADVTFQIFGWG
jgi:hypothetical protein